MIIYPMTEDHAESILQIYQEGISTGNATFQTTAPSWEDWNKSHFSTCRLVAVENDQAGIFPENTGSVKIHEANGFRQTGRRESIEKMGDWWRDTLLLDRRSTKVGI